MATNNEFMVTDIQGWKLEMGNYKVTDPIWFSKEKVFGTTDRGELGMNEWLTNHKCNFRCRCLNQGEEMKLNSNLVKVLRSIAAVFKEKHKSKSKKLEDVFKGLKD